VRYEDLCTAPARELTAICRMLDVEFEEEMLALQSAGHGLDGNRLRYDAAIRREIRLDERWRGELSEADLRQFERVAGGTNRQFGYA
jgi:hypothetical protein